MRTGTRTLVDDLLPSATEDHPPIDRSLDRRIQGTMALPSKARSRPSSADAPAVDAVLNHSDLSETKGILGCRRRHAGPAHVAET